MTYHCAVSFQRHSEPSRCCSPVDIPVCDETTTSAIDTPILRSMTYLRMPLRKAVAMAAARLGDCVFLRIDLTWVFTVGVETPSCLAICESVCPSAIARMTLPSL